MESAPVIRKLNEAVINRIAAGEVVQKPSAAIKEMLENSIDARSTQINISIKGGGLMLMQIQDNGHGIRKDDLPIVCERFTTSKLAEFDDLKKISTFGFRGEALASITYVSNVTITSKTADSQCAFKAKYLDGQLVPTKPGDSLLKPCAGVNGTTITVEDLFYNMPTRKQAFKNISEQYQKVLDVVSKYSIHFGNRNIAFTCKKLDTKGTNNAPDLITPNNSSVLENIKIVFGNSIAKELIDFEVNNNSFDLSSSLCAVQSGYDNGGSSSSSSNHDGYGDSNLDDKSANKDVIFDIKGKISNANYANNKKANFILFINNRLVDSSSIRRVVDEVYSDILPRHSHPFVYLSLIMPSHHVDVNVHPTKKEVHFLYEDRILLSLHKALTEKLKSSNDSRIFATQTLMTSHLLDFDMSRSNNNNNSNNSNSNSSSNNNNSNNSNSNILISQSNSNEWNDPVDSFGSDINSKGRNTKNNKNNGVFEDRRSNGLNSSFDSADSNENRGSNMVSEGTFNFNGNGESGMEEAGSGDDNAFDGKADDEDDDGEDRTYLGHEEGSSSSYNRRSSGNNNNNSNSNNNKRMRHSAKNNGDAISTNETSHAISKAAVAPSRLVRIDPKVVRIDSIFLPKHNSSSSSSMSNLDFGLGDGDFCQVVGSSNVINSSFGRKINLRSLSCPCCATAQICVDHSNSNNNVVDSNASSSYTASSSSAMLPVGLLNQLGHRQTAFAFEDSICEYESIATLRAEILHSRSSDIENILKNFVFVGIVDQSNALLQHKTKLLLINLGKFLQFTVYQLILRRFGCLPVLKLQARVSVKAFVRMALDDPSLAVGVNSYLSAMSSSSSSSSSSSTGGGGGGGGGLDNPTDKDSLADMVSLLLREKAEMLSEYFSVSIDSEGFLTQLPNVINGLTLNPLGLPKLLLRLATEVSWDDEMACFRSIALELSLFFSDLSSMDANVSPNPALHVDYQAYVRDFVLPVVKMYLVPPKTISAEGWIVEVASLEELYKIFERC